MSQTVTLVHGSNQYVPYFFLMALQPIVGLYFAAL